MKVYILKRLLNAVLIMWAVATVVFFGLRFIPGGPAAAILGENANPERIQALERSLGLNKPIFAQYIDWFTGVLQFDFGDSVRTSQSVNEIIAIALPKSISIGFVGVVIGLLLSIPAGIISATRKDTVPDYVATISAFLGLSMPAFYIGILLMVLFAVWLNLFPVFGYTSPSEGIIPWLRGIILPGLAVGLPYAAVLMRMTRSSLLEVMNEQYMKTARAKGVNSRIRLFKHALQNALIPVVTIAGIQFALIISGSVTVELVYGIRGMGTVIVESIRNQDYPVAQGVIIVVAFGFVLVNLLVDILYTVINPEIKYGEK
jgi:peptide/nickel transport system permease protein